MGKSKSKMKKYYVMVLLLILVIGITSVHAARQIEVDAPEGRKLVAVVAQPAGTGPLPVVIIFHGAEGFREYDAPLADEFAAGGFIAIVGCWFAGSAPRYRSLTGPSTATSFPLLHS